MSRNITEVLTQIFSGWWKTDVRAAGGLTSTLIDVGDINNFIKWKLTFDSKYLMFYGSPSIYPCENQDKNMCVTGQYI